MLTWDHRGTSLTIDWSMLLINWAGAEHRVTSAYNPRTNGLTERFNQTLIESLRKHSETNPHDWPKWLPFVLMAYRTRVHSKTQFSPFELMFGRKMNKFEDWQNQKLDDEVSELIQRAVELETLQNEMQQTALGRIDAAQELQKSIQNTRNPPRIEPLEEGTTVFVKTEGILSKLDALFSGPYKVSKITNSGNYDLLDTNDTKLKYSYPLHKLKVVNNPSDLTPESFEVEKIVSKRKDGREYEYLVKWKDCPDSENTWLKAKHFNSIEPIKEFERLLKNGVIKKKVGRPAKNKIISLNLISILVYLLFISSIYGFTIENDFKFCDHTNSLNVLLDIDNSCDRPKKVLVDVFPINVSLKLTVLVKNKHPIYGSGFQCKKEIIETTFWMTFFGNRLSNSKSHIVTLTKSECESMKQSKRCEDVEMSCEGENCFAVKEPVEEYSWFQPITKHGIKCSITTRVINGDNLNSSLFNSATHACKAT